MNKSTKYLLVSLATFIAGYFYLRFAYQSTGDVPFAQEIVLIILGTIVTISITAALLNKQSEVELEKEQRVKIFDRKSDLYFELINFIESVIRKSEIKDEDIITLEFLTHKISIIANPEVLSEYSNFIQIFKKTSLDHKINKLESDELSYSLATLCGKIRYDLLTKDKQSKLEVQHMIKSNIEKI